jgi:hypothetical protein
MPAKKGLRQTLVSCLIIADVRDTGKLPERPSTASSTASSRKSVATFRATAEKELQKSKLLRLAENAKKINVSNHDLSGYDFSELFEYEVRYDLSYLLNTASIFILVIRKYQRFN